MDVNKALLDFLKSNGYLVIKDEDRLRIIERGMTQCFTLTLEKCEGNVYKLCCDLGCVKCFTSSKDKEFLLSRLAIINTRVMPAVLKIQPRSIHQIPSSILDCGMYLFIRFQLDQNIMLINFIECLMLGIRVIEEDIINYDKFHTKKISEFFKYLNRKFSHAMENLYKYEKVEERALSNFKDNLSKIRFDKTKDNLDALIKNRLLIRKLTCCKRRIIHNEH